MKKIQPLYDNYKTIRQKTLENIRPHLSGLDQYNQSDYQKQVELCQLGKLLISYFPNFLIEEVREKPDFIISDGDKRIALEHQSILDIETKRIQGFFENLFHIAERDLRKDDSLPNFLVNCYLDKHLSFKNSDKNELIKTIKDTVVEFVLNDRFVENGLIHKMIKIPHSQKNLCVNFGAYMVTDLDARTIIEFIDKKEGKVDGYRQNTNDLEQWLLLVTSGIGEYSFDIERPIKGVNINSNFDKIYVMLDFKNDLYELK